jgi:SAM-dependent methyltransferase
MCGGKKLKSVFVYDKPMEGETIFKIDGENPYEREVKCCEKCGHFICVQKEDLSDFYEGEYVRGTYGQKLKDNFDRIVALPEDQSDNAGRVKRIDDFAGGREKRTVLDVGAGLGVFLHRMKQAGWEGVALDPDKQACKHIRDVVGIKTICTDFMEAGEIGKFDVVTFNKVLEHVKDPAAMLVKAQEYVKPGGLIYVEVPDGELAVEEGMGREEFFLGHWHIFSVDSLKLLFKQAGLEVVSIDRLREPSGKFTVWAFGALRAKG